MFPSPGVWPYFVVHLALCAVVTAYFARALARETTLPRAILAVLGVALFGGILSFFTAPRLPGGYGFAVALAWSWTGALVMPPVLALTGVLLLRARVRRSWIFPVLAGAIAVASFDAFVVEPQSLEVNRHLVHTRVDAPLRIAVIADMQTDAPGEHEADALRAVMAEHPDVIIFPGDIIQAFDATSYAEGWASLRAIIDEVGLDAPLGVYATQGDVEHSGWVSELEGTGITALDGTVQLRADAVLSGIDLRHSAIPHAIERPKTQGAHIVAGHRPDFALGDVDADVLVAGHTHGGQVQLPLLGPIITLTHVPRSWAAGRTDIDDARTLVVSRGVGMERGIAPRVRFLCPPEVVIIDLLPDIL